MAITKWDTESNRSYCSQEDCEYAGFRKLGANEVRTCHLYYIIC